MDTFTIRYNRAYEASIEFKTIIDGAYTSHEQRNSLWTNPRHRWVLEFEKTPEAFNDLKAFFLAQKGSFRAFQWVWDSAKGGDGNTYTVRFDSDKLEFRVNEMGYKTLQIPIVEVVTNE